MTKVARWFEEEKIEAVHEKILEVAKKLLEEGVDVLTIMKTTGLSKAAILELADDAAEA